MTDLIGVPPSPGDGEAKPKVPQTPRELRQAIERGEMGGEIIYEGEAAAELEKRRKITIRAGEITSARLQQAASDLEARAMDGEARIDLHTRHQMMSDALAFRRTAGWLHATDHPEQNGGS